MLKLVQQISSLKQNLLQKEKTYSINTLWFSSRVLHPSIFHVKDRQSHQPLQGLYLQVKINFYHTYRNVGKPNFKQATGI